jgi:ABC-type multidrug transport system ATPase subunit
MDRGEEIVRMNMSLLEDVLPINVAVKDLKVCTKAGKDIISNVNLSFKAGQVVGIMGSSGSGKTTLLNALSGRSLTDHMQGNILFNNSDSAFFHRNQMTAYVQQNDYLMPYLTVRECLQYTAELRLGSLSRKEKYRAAQDVILELGLKDCADTIIGDDWRKGISGGERRRVSVAVQLLVNPSLIFLDEPTTGN